MNKFPQAFCWLDEDVRKLIRDGDGDDDLCLPLDPVVSECWWIKCKLLDVVCAPSWLACIAAVAWCCGGIARGEVAVGDSDEGSEDDAIEDDNDNDEEISWLALSSLLLALLTIVLMNGLFRLLASCVLIDDDLYELPTLAFPTVLFGFRLPASALVSIRSMSSSSFVLNDTWLVISFCFWLLNAFFKSNVIGRLRPGKAFELAL